MLVACISALARRRNRIRCRPPRRIKLETRATNRPLRPRRARSQIAKRSNPSSNPLNRPMRLRPRLLRRRAPRRRLNHRRAVQIRLGIKAANRSLRPRQIRNRPARRSHPTSRSLNQPNRLRRLQRRPAPRLLLNPRRPRRLQPRRRHQLMTTWQRVAPRPRVERPGNRRRSPVHRRPQATPGQGVWYSGSARRAIRLSPARTCSVRRFPALSAARRARKPASTIRRR